MGRQYTQEQAVNIMSSIHNNFYSYDKVVYESAVKKILVTCPLHGDFLTTFTNHTHKTSPRGCPDCGLERRARKRTLPVEDFLEIAKSVHGDLYDYSGVEYVNKDTKVKINCNKHGGFWQTPEKHEAGKGCPSCAGKGAMTYDRFIKRATEKHGDRYSYELVTDESFKGKPSAIIEIKCHVHGVFKQNFNNHLFGQGCRKCAKFGFNVNKSGTLYVLSDGSRVKIGITNRKVETRLKEINKPCGNFSIIKVYEYSSGVACAKQETDTLRYLRERYSNSAKNFSGFTETFDNVDLESLLFKLDREYNE